MQSRGRNEVRETEIGRPTVEKLVGQLVMLSRSDEACRLLGIEGILGEQVDVTFLDEPLDYVASDIAVAIRDAEDDSAPGMATMLATLIAELRLCGIVAGHVEQHDLIERVMRHLREL